MVPHLTVKRTPPQMTVPSDMPSGPLSRESSTLFSLLCRTWPGEDLPRDRSLTRAIATPPKKGLA